jgi:hypothetical protein
MLALLVALAFAPADAAHRPSVEFARAVMTADAQVRKVRRGQEEAATAARTALHACLDDWKARPDEYTEELLTFYDVATTAPLWPAERPAAAQLVEKLAAIKGAGRYTPLRVARRTLRRQLARLDAVYGEPIDACAEVKAWRAAAWKARPPAIARIHRLIPGPPGHHDDRLLYRAQEFVARHAPAWGRRLRRLVWEGVSAPQNRDNCDDVLIALAPDEAFC